MVNQLPGLFAEFSPTENSAFLNHTVFDHNSFK
jgi:hypothetical protein